jgi:hypothetical protein
MIKLFSVIHKRPEITIEKFYKYWKDVHGPLVVNNIPAIRRYVQNHLVDITGYEYEGNGIEEIWLDIFEGSHNITDFISLVVKKLNLGEDWAKIAVISPPKIWVAKEHTIMDTGAVAKIKTLSLVNKRADISFHEFYKYWKDVHGPLVAKHIPYLRKYVQNHLIPLSGIEYDGDSIIETWYDDVESFQKSLAFNKTSKANKLGLGADFAKIADMSVKHIMWVATEHIIKG